MTFIYKTQKKWYAGLSYPVKMNEDYVFISLTASKRAQSPIIVELFVC